MEKCKRHDWRVGAFIGDISPVSKRIIKKGIYIFCWKCNKKIKAYYSYYAKNNKKC